MQKITTFLMYNSGAEEAAKHYASVFKNAKVTSVGRGPDGAAMSVNFEIEGQGIDKKFMTSLSPDESKVLHVDLAPGNYKVICPVKDHEEEGMKLNVTVK